MKKRRICWSVAFLLAFALWTALVCFVDVQSIGPNGSSVGFAAINGWFHRLTGTNMTLYVITDWLGLVPVAVCLGFAILGLCQWIKRKNILKVDANVLALGGFYVVVMAVYVLFEYVVVNRRPVLIDGFLEASYPSSTTMLVLCVMPTAAMQFRARIQNAALRRTIIALIVVFTAFMVAGRLVSGVHWLTDIVGGGLFSAGAVLLYQSLTE